MNIVSAFEIVLALARQAVITKKEGQDPQEVEDQWRAIRAVSDYFDQTSDCWDR